MFDVFGLKLCWLFLNQVVFSPRIYAFTHEHKSDAMQNRSDEFQPFVATENSLLSFPSYSNW